MDTTISGGKSSEGAPAGTDGPVTSADAVRLTALTTTSSSTLNRTQLSLSSPHHGPPPFPEGPRPQYHNQPLPAPAALKRATFAVEDDDDAELQAALALSLQQEYQPHSTATTAFTSAALSSSASSSPVMHEELLVFDKEQEPLDVTAFHSIMWDPNVTTHNDQLRWLGQAINVRPVEPAASAAGTTQQQIPYKAYPPLPPTNTMLDQIVSSHLSWGLLQQFGGPCGVLAAVQAEMLRLLLFGRLSHNNGTTLHYPTESSAPLAPIHFLTPELVDLALAYSLALLVARAALTPLAVQQSNQPQPEQQQQQQQQQQQLPSNSAPPPKKLCARLVLPTNLDTKEPLAWSDLGPWSNSNARLSSFSSKLSVYTISLPCTCSSKRQKTTVHKDIHDHESDQHESTAAAAAAAAAASFKDDEDQQTTIRLARVVAQFLLQNNKTALDHFKRDGGVMLLTMSMVQSRGVSSLQLEFDDPNTKLTSQFGHCAQELINLLLTGQAVSNVFDHSLTLGNDMECRGIVRQPSIGYLTQLEALRLCEVGTFYKSPKFPIWVVGSTSHFTVLFGTRSALKESKSDALLDQCRRAFKAVEGGGENGFIAQDKLEIALAKLNLVDAVGPGAISTLAAAISMSGIILWDDFWKTASRLLTGATIENILDNSTSATTSSAQNAATDAEVIGANIEPTGGGGGMSSSAWGGWVDDDTTISSGTQFIPSTIAALTETTPNAAGSSAINAPISVETDEEMARRLSAAEFGGHFQNNDGGGMSALSSAVALRAASPMEVETATTIATTTPVSVMMSDEELARTLQAEWNAEMVVDNNLTQNTAFVGPIHVSGRGDTGSDAAVDGDDDDPLTRSNFSSDFDDSTILPPTPPLGSKHSSRNALLSDDIVMQEEEEEDSKPAAKDTTKTDASPSLAFEQYGDTFSLYHYNGLRGGILTPLRVTRLTPEEAVGASIALHREGSGNNSDGSSADLAEVLCTKYPSCRIDWLGQAPPYIN